MPNDKSSVKNNLYNFDNLFSTLFNSKYWIIGLSSAFTILLIVFASTKTPIYQASTNMSVGTYEVFNLDCDGERIRKTQFCQQTSKANAIFMHSEIIKNKISTFARINLENEILVIDNENNSLTIQSRAVSIEKAKSSLQKIDKFIAQLNLKNIEALENDRDAIKRKLEKRVLNLVNWELTPIQKENDYKLLVLEEKITFHNAKLKNLVSTITNILNRKIVEISEQINHVENFELPFYTAKISSREAQLKLSNSMILELKKQLKQSNLLLSNINLNETTETKSLDLNNTNMISLRLKESQYLRDSIFRTSEKILKLELEVAKTEKIMNLKLEHLDILSKQNSLKESLVLLNIYAEKWFANENALLDASNLLEVFAVEELGGLTMSTDGQIKFNVANIIITLEEEKNDIINTLALLLDEKYSYINFVIPKDKLEMYAIKAEINNVGVKIDRYKELIASKAYINTAFTGEIYAPKKQLTPNLKLYAGFGFLGSLSLFLFLFSLLSLISLKKKNV